MLDLLCTYRNSEKERETGQYSFHFACLLYVAQAYACIVSVLNVTPYSRRTITIGALTDMKILTALLLALLFTTTVYADCIEGNCVDGHGRMTYDDERVGMGHGAFTFTNRAKYAIEWTGDKPQTQGPWAYSDGGKYVGAEERN
jgi:hypothetical protein